MIAIAIIALIWIASVIGSIRMLISWFKEKEPLPPYPKVTAPPNDYYNFII